VGQTRAVEGVHERCGACGFEGEGYTDAALLDDLRSLGQRWRQLLGAAGIELRSRPEPDTWSALEYAAHSRDITALHAYGVEQALVQDEPVIPAVGDDLIESAAATYGDEDPDAVLDALAAEAERLAQLAEDAGVDAWTRGLTVGEERSEVRRLLEHALHDSRHHLDDVERGLAELGRE
jgi:DinB family protein